LEGHLAELIVTIGATSKAEFLHFMQRLSPDSVYDPILLRRTELAQRYLLGGQPEAVEDLAYPTRRRNAKDMDAVLANLDILARIRLNSVLLSGFIDDKDDKMVSSLIDTYLGWSDFSVIHADKSESNAERAVVIHAYRRALDAGLPALGYWLDKLRLGVEYYHIDHPRAALLQRVSRTRMEAFLWTAWMPGPITTGKPLAIN
jgi:hypothetical protein